MADIGTRRKMKLRERWGALVANKVERRLEGKIVNPSPGYRVSYPYGVRSASYQAGHHTGEDHACPVGTKVEAVSFGHVIFAGWGSAPGGWGPAYGNMVVVESNQVDPKTGKHYRYAYCHLSRIDVHNGAPVHPGKVVGLSGQTGNVTGPHLHFEARRSPYYYGSDIPPLRVKQRKAR